jgi:hypothetical protein
MFAEYTYFRAQGQSLSAIETVEEAKAELCELKEKLCRKFGAESVSGWVDRDTERFSVQSFLFRAPQKPPEGWVDSISGGALKATANDNIHALPAPGSADNFHVAGMAGLMERAGKRAALETALGSGKMPMRDVPEGNYSNIFVRYRTHIDPANPPAKPDGTQVDGTRGVVGMSGGKVRIADPLAYKELDGAWYIRVPNRPGTEIPVFTPPDAVETGYDAMLAADRAEQQQRFNKLRASVYDLPSGF